MASQFSKDGKYFAQISSEGKLKIWNTLSNTFEQEFTPDFHLTTPCTCLHFIENDSNLNKPITPRKKKRRESKNLSTTNIALGTNSGLLLIYSLTKGDLDYTINSGNIQSVNCLSSYRDEMVYSGVESDVFVWDLSKRSVDRKWAIGKERISAILVVENGSKLLTATKSIKLWNIDRKELLKTFTGHQSEISMLYSVPPNVNNKTDEYFISASKDDRILNCWSLNDKSDGRHAAATFLMDNPAININAINSPLDGSTHLAVTDRSGVVHMYQHTLNGIRKSSKPQKPKTSLQIVTCRIHADESSEIVPLDITGAVLTDPETLLFGYGSQLVQIFEKIAVPKDKTFECLSRDDPFAIDKVKAAASANKTRTPIVDDSVHYISGEFPARRSKRKIDGCETSMEQRLENLALNGGGGAVPKGENVAQLLLQGLQSHDRKILQTVLYKRDEQVIRNTVRRLPMSVIVPLVGEINDLISGKTLASQVGALWLKNVIVCHAGILMANPDLGELFGTSLGAIEARLALQTPLQRLKGRLDLLVSQVNNVVGKDLKESEEALLIYNDKVIRWEDGKVYYGINYCSSDEDDEIELYANSSSENDWEEDSTDEDQDTLMEKIE